MYIHMHSHSSPTPLALTSSEGFSSENSAAVAVSQWPSHSYSHHDQDVINTCGRTCRSRQVGAVICLRTIHRYGVCTVRTAFPGFAALETVDWHPRTAPILAALFPRSALLSQALAGVLWLSMTTCIWPFSVNGLHRMDVSHYLILNRLPTTHRRPVPVT